MDLNDLTTYGEDGQPRGQSVSAKKDENPCNTVCLSPGKTLLRCVFPGCTKIFKKEAHRKQHEYVHTGERPYMCQFKDCGKAFTRPYHLKRHQVVHNEGNKTMFKCTVSNCFVSCSSTYGLKKHIMRKHDGPFKCTFSGCPQSFQNQKYLKAHEREHSGVENQHRCPEPMCGKSFHYLSKLKKHAKKHEGYLCKHDSCGKRCSTFGELRTHTKVSHTVIECEVCGKTFSSKSSKKQHLVIHRANREQDFVRCPEEGCNGNFVNAKSLKSHLYVAHGNADKLQCPVEGCSQTFVTKHTLNRHLRNHEVIEQRLKCRTKNRKKKMKKRRKQTRIVTNNLIKITGIIPSTSKYMDVGSHTDSETDMTSVNRGISKTISRTLPDSDMEFPPQETRGKDVYESSDTIAFDKDKNTETGIAKASVWKDDDWESKMCNESHKQEIAQGSMYKVGQDENPSYERVKIVDDNVGEFSHDRTPLVAIGWCGPMARKKDQQFASLSTAADTVTSVVSS